MSEFKYIYQFTSSRSGDEYLFRFKEPNRAEKSDLSIFYSKTLFDMLKKGMPSVNMLDKLYSDNVNGVLSEKDHKRFIKLQEELFDMQKELDEAGDDEDKKLDILQRFNKIRAKMNEIQLQQESIYNNTAEIYARNRVIEKLILDLSFYKKIDGPNFIPFFGNGDHENKLDKLDELTNDKSDFNKNSISKLFSVATLYWIHGIEDQERIKEILDGVSSDTKEEVDDTQETVEDKPAKKATKKVNRKV